MNNINKYLNQNLKVNINADIRVRKEIILNEEYTLYFLGSLANQEIVTNIIESLRFSNHQITNLCVPYFYYEDDLSKVVDSVLVGDTAIVLPNKKIIICDTKKYPNRGINIPEVEKSVRGSKDSFNENIIDNIALIRRRIKDKKLTIKLFTVSKESKMSVCLLYMNDADKKIVNKLIRKIKKLSLDSLIMADRGLEEGLFKQKYNIFPIVRYTERPDVTSINLIRGKIVLLVDTSSNAIILPISVFDHFKNVEEYKQNPLIGSFTKTLRIIGSLISTFLVPLFILFTFEDGYDNGIIPLYKFELSNPLLVEVIVITLVLEIIRIAIVHTPNALMSSLSLLGAIVLGEVSLSLGLFSPEILLVTSLAIICNYATPSYELSLANRFISLIFIIMTCLFKASGFLISALLLFIYISSMKILDLPYLYPICPFDLDMFKRMFIRIKTGKKK